MKRFEEFIKELYSNGCTGYSIAKTLNISPAIVNGVIKNDKRRLSQDVLEKVAQALGLECAIIFYDPSNTNDVSAINEAHERALEKIKRAVITRKTEKKKNEKVVTVQDKVEIKDKVEEPVEEVEITEDDVLF